MAEVQKTCAVCGKQIEININNIYGVAKLQSKYYHPECLAELAAKRVQRNSHAEYWDYAHNNLNACEKDACEAIFKRYWQDKLNEHLLKHYDVVVIPSRFWEIVADLGNGIWRGNKCKAVPLNSLYGCWEWGQQKLDGINRYNKSEHKGPDNDKDRIRYDLAIVLNHMRDYEKFLLKQKTLESEKERKMSQTKVDYDSLSHRTEVKSEGLDDISNMIDDFF